MDVMMISLPQCHSPPPVSKRRRNVATDSDENETDNYDSRRADEDEENRTLENVNVIQASEPRVQVLLDEEYFNVDDSNLTGIPPDRPAEAFLDLKCWLAQGCTPSNSEYMDWLQNCVDNDYAFSSLLECWQGKGRFQRNKWRVAKVTNDCWSFETLGADEYENAKERAYNMLHNWLRKEDKFSGTMKSVVWSTAEKALSLFRECLAKAEEYDTLHPGLDVSRAKIGYIRGAAWRENNNASREFKDAVGDELLLLLIIYELLRDLKRDDMGNVSDNDLSDGSEALLCRTTGNEDLFKNEVLRARNAKSGIPPQVDENDEPTPSEIVSPSEDGDDSGICRESVCALSARVPCGGRGIRFKAIALMDILLNNATLDCWEPDLDVDLLKMVIDAMGAGEENPLNRKVVLPALSKLLTYWACQFSDFEQDHWDLLSDILPALQALKKKWTSASPPEGRASILTDSSVGRPTKRARRTRCRNDTSHIHHLRSEKIKAFSSLKECSSSFPTIPSNGEGGINDLTQCVETLTWMLDEKCLEWMMDSEWRPENFLG